MKFLSKLTTGIFLFTLLLPNTFAFLDVPEGIWYEEAVNYLEQEQIIDSGDFFRPGDKATRAEASEMLAKTLGLLENYQPPLNSPYKDVSIDEDYYTSMMALSEARIISGDTDNQGNLLETFRPNEFLKRSEISKMLVQGFELSGQDLPKNPFPDVQNENTWYYKYTNTLWGWNIISGYLSGPEAGNFGPGNEVLRAEMAKMLFELMQTLPQEEPEPEPTPEPEEPTLPDEEMAPEEPTPEPEVIQEPFVANTEAIRRRIIGDGETHLAAQYYFQGIHQGYTIQKLTITNDIVGNTIGDDPQGSKGIDKVILKYADKDGFLKTKESPFRLSGETIFSNLEFFAKEDQSNLLEVYVKTNAFGGVSDELSGETIRLGVQEVNTSSTFEAIGEFSGQLNEFDGNTDLHLSYFESDEMVIREGGALKIKTVPVNNEALFSGSTQLIGLNFEHSGSTSLNRLVFQISVDGNVTLSDFKLRKNSDIVDDITIYDATGAQDLSTGNLPQGVHQVIVSFDQEEGVSNPGKDYFLEVEAAGVQEGDYVITRLLEDDNPLSGLSAENQENTGKIYVMGDATAGIFTNDTDFSRVVGTDRNLIWSDESGSPHQNPDITAGVVQPSSGSSDYTNGAYLDWREVDSQILSR